MTTDREVRSNRTSVMSWLFVFVIFVVLYGATSQRGVGWQDSGRFQWRVLNGDYAGTGGIALAHPLYMFIATAMNHLPWGASTYRINLTSAIGMAVALANLGLLIRQVTRNTWVALIGPAMLGVMHTVWWLSTIAEVYTWNAAGLTVELLLLVRLLRRPSRATVAWLFLVSGLDLCIHNMALLSLPVYGVVLVRLIARRCLPWYCLAIALGSFLLGGAWIIVLAAQDAMKSGVIHAVESTLFGPFVESVLNLSYGGALLRVNASLASLNFLSFVPLLAAIGVARARRRLEPDLAWALLGLLCVHAFFVIRYFVPDQFTFLIPTLTLVVLMASIGVDWLWAMAATPVRKALVLGVCALCLATPPVVYLAGPRLLSAAHLYPPGGMRHPYRDEVRYWLQPWKQNETSAETFGVLTATWLERNDPHSIVLADSTSYPPLMLVQQLYGLAPRVIVEKDGDPLPEYDEDAETFKERLGDRSLYVLTTDQRYVSTRLLSDAVFAKVPDMMLYKLSEWRR